MGHHAYASDGVAITLAGSTLALICAAGLWGAYRVQMPRPVPSIVIGISCYTIVYGVFVQGYYTEWVWQIIADVSVLLNLFMYVEIARAIRSRRSTIPLAIALPMCCRVARDGPDQPHHPALRAGRGGGVREAV
jgi:hypothetical protein